MPRFRNASARARALEWTIVVLMSLASSRAAATPLVAAKAGPAEHPSAATDPSAEAANSGRPPDTSSDLTERARHLFEAITGDNAETADDFFFPREPFLSLKDVRDPSGYHAELVRAFHRDIRRTRSRRRSWEGAKFLSFELGSRPRWVKPGEEWNKIGYFRTWNGKLRYEIGGHERILQVHTIISWDGRWYVTHLRRKGE